MDLLRHLLPILALAGLAAGWVAVQLLARRIGTKNHIDHAGSCGNGCSCGGEQSCEWNGRKAAEQGIS